MTPRSQSALREAEASVEQKVIELARLAGWRLLCKSSQGYRPGGKGHGTTRITPGFPDLVRDHARKSLARRLELEADADVLEHGLEALVGHELLEAAIAGLLFDRLEWDEDVFDRFARQTDVDFGALFDEAREQKRNPVAIPEDILGPFPLIAKTGKATSGYYDDRPWHLIKPRTTATTLCGLRVSVDVVKREGFPARHGSPTCAKCEQAIEKMLKARRKK